MEKNAWKSIWNSTWKQVYTEFSPFKILASIFQGNYYTSNDFHAFDGASKSHKRIDWPRSHNYF